MKQEPEIYVHIIDLENTASRECVTLNEDGSYSIFVNARQASNIQLDAYRHALEHIREDHFSAVDVQKIEAEAHGIVKSPESEPKPAKKKKNRVESLMKSRERRAKVLARLGLEEVNEIADGEYGEPVIKTRVRFIGGK